MEQRRQLTAEQIIADENKRVLSPSEILDDELRGAANDEDRGSATAGGQSGESIPREDWKWLDKETVARRDFR